MSTIWSFTTISNSPTNNKYIMKQTRTKYGDNATVINALHAIGAWPVASTVQIYETARAHGFGYVGAAEVFMTNKVGRGKWDVTGVDAGGAVTAPTSSGTKRAKKAGKPVLSSVTPVLKKTKGKKAKEQAWPEGTKILQDEGEPDTIVIDTVHETMKTSEA
jgi:hypothetical protein